MPSRLTRRQDFVAVTRHGRRAASRTVVVHALNPGHPTPLDPTPTPARIGFVVSRAVGTAVVRNRVTRRLRHACVGSLDHLGGDVVVRALPRAATSAYDSLRRDLESCLTRAGALPSDDPPDSPGVAGS